MKTLTCKVQDAARVKAELIAKGYRVAIQVDGDTATIIYL